MISSLVRESNECKQAARDLGTALPTPEAGDDDEPPPTLIATVAGSLALSFRPRALAREQGKPAEVREWDRIMVGYLVLLCVWCWESPTSVREVLEEGGALGTLIEPITHTSEVDVLVQGLCAYLLAICYEYNREGGEITRATIHPIIQSRIGPDTFISRITQLRDDERFKALGPDSLVVDISSTDANLPHEGGAVPSSGETWLNWTFVEFVKGTYYTLQRAVTSDPETVTATSAVTSVESATLIASLRDSIQKQATEVEDLRKQLKQLTQERNSEVDGLKKQIEQFKQEHDHGAGSLKGQLDQLTKEREAEVEELRKQLQQVTQERDDERQKSTTMAGKVGELEKQMKVSEEKKKEAEKEQEDLLVLLEELSTKRKRDKAKMREKSLEVSEDEAEDDEDDDDEDEDDEDEEDDE
jgi:hypothetical protein